MSIINVPNHDLKFYRGDTAIRTVKIWDESVKPRQLQDLTGATALMKLRATATTAQSQGVFGFVEKELPIEWVGVGV
jgi:hypothetical protein